VKRHTHNLFLVLTGGGSKIDTIDLLTDFNAACLIRLPCMSFFICYQNIGNISAKLYDTVIPV
jgi:hypothetical protein